MSEGLSWTALIALIGAGAWIPHVVKHFQRPRVTAIPGSAIEIGWTGLGPILNPTLAFRTERRDALVTAVTFDIRHESGQSERFVSQTMRETPGRSQSSTGEIAVMTREHSAGVVVVTPTSISECHIACRTEKDMQKVDELMVRYEAAVRRVVDPDPDARFRVLMQTPEAQALQEYWDSRFIWQAGKYSCVCRVAVAELKESATVEFEFDIRGEQIALLKSNSAGLKYELLRIAGALPPSGPKQFNWAWIYPQVRRSSAAVRA